MISENILYGKRLRQPTKEEKNITDKLSYGLGTHATIGINQYGKYEYVIYELRNTWVDDSRYDYFDTLENAKKHLIDTFGGKWKWSKNWI